MNIKRILVPTDFSEQSFKALDYALDFARGQNAEVLLVHVVEPIRHTRFISDVSEVLERQGEEAAAQLADLEKKTHHRYRKCRSEVHFGIPYEMIAEAARNWKADLIIIATHGYTGMNHLFLGSVTERVVRISACPVLTIRTAEPPLLRRHRRLGKSPALKKSRRPRSIHTATDSRTKSRA